MDVVGPGRFAIDDDASADEVGDDDHRSCSDRSDSDRSDSDRASVDLDLRPRTGPTTGDGAGNGGGGKGGGAGGSGPVIHGRRPNGRGRSGSARRWPWLVVLVGLIGGIGFVIFHAISDATLFYLNADEAIVRQAELGTKHFRLQGSVVSGSVHETKGEATFSFKVAYNGKEVNVQATGDPPQLFQPCIPVVLDGRWQGTGPDAVFASSQIIVAHDSTYEAQNSDRLKAAEAQAKTNGGEQSTACLVDEVTGKQAAGASGP